MLCYTCIKHNNLKSRNEIHYSTTNYRPSWWFLHPKIHINGFRPSQKFSESTGQCSYLMKIASRLTEATSMSSQKSLLYISTFSILSTYNVDRMC